MTHFVDSNKSINQKNEFSLDIATSMKVQSMRTISHQFFSVDFTKGIEKNHCGVYQKIGLFFG